MARSPTELNLLFDYSHYVSLTHQSNQSYTFEWSRYLLWWKHFFKNLIFLSGKLPSWLRNVSFFLVEQLFLRTETSRNCIAKAFLYWKPPRHEWKNTQNLTIQVSSEKNKAKWRQTGNFCQGCPGVKIWMEQSEAVIHPPPL